MVEEPLAEHSNQLLLSQSLNYIDRPAQPTVGVGMCGGDV